MNLIAPLVSTRMMTLLEVSTSSLYFSSLSLRADSALNRPYESSYGAGHGHQYESHTPAPIPLQPIVLETDETPESVGSEYGTIMNDLTPIVSSGPLADGGRSRVLPRMGIPPERIGNHWGMELYAS